MVVHIIVEGTVYFMYKEIFCPNNFILLFKREDGLFHQHILAAPLNLNADIISHW